MNIIPIWPIKLLIKPGRIEGKYDKFGTTWDFFFECLEFFETL